MITDVQTGLKASELFSVGARLMAIHFAFMDLRMVPFLFVAPSNPETVWGIIVPILFTTVASVGLFLAADRLAVWLGISDSPTSVAISAEDLLAIGLILVSLYALINSTFSLISIVSAISGGLELPATEMIGRSLPILISLLVILAARPLSRLLFRLRWRGDRSFWSPEDPSV